MRKEILAFIKRATRHLRNQHFIEYSIVGLMLSLIGCLIFLLVSLGITIPYANEKGIGIVLIGMAICEIYAMIKVPKSHEVTLKVDQTGLEERLSTALMLMDSEEPLSKLQRKDTLVHIQSYELKKHFPYHFSIKKIGISLLLIVACIGVCMIPTKAKQEENELRLFEKEKQELMAQVDEQIEKLEEVEELSVLTKEELASLLEKSKGEIPKSQDEEEVKKSMDRLAKKLDNLAKENKKPKEQEAINQINKALTEPFQKKAQDEAQSDLETLSETLSKNEWTKDLAESLKQEDGAGENSDEQLEEALKELQKQIEEMSEAEKQALANALSQLAADLNSEQLASQLSQASSSLANGTLNTQNLQAALKNLKQMAMSNASSMSQSGGQGQNSNNSGNQQGNNNSSGNGSGQGSGSGNGSGNGNGSGSGSGSGSGQGGGWNSGSKHGNEVESTGNKAEQIPEAMPGYDANVSGKVDESTNIEQGEIAYGINIAGQKVDYHSVVGDYTEEALENIEQEAVPEHMKDAIKDYFEAINQ